MPFPSPHLISCLSSLYLLPFFSLSITCPARRREIKGMKENGDDRRPFPFTLFIWPLPAHFPRSLLSFLVLRVNRRRAEDGKRQATSPSPANHSLRSFTWHATPRADRLREVGRWGVSSRSLSSRPILFHLRHVPFTHYCPA